MNPKTLQIAGVHWHNTWTDFGTAYTTYRTYRTRGIQGVGFVLTPDDPYVAIDLDACIKEDILNEYANDIIATLGSYTEISPLDRAFAFSSPVLTFGIINVIPIVSFMRKPAM